MGRVLVAALVATLVTIAIGWFYWHRITADLAAERAVQQDRLSRLEQRRAQLDAENRRLEAELEKVRKEQERLAAINQELSQALEKARLTGKVPALNELPYPPK